MYKKKLKDPQGNEVEVLELTQEEFEETIKGTAKEAVEEFVKESGITKPNVPKAVASAAAGQRHDQGDGQDFVPRLNETQAQRNDRLSRAVESVKGGNLRLVHAPKEIKMVRFVKALYQNDGATVRELGEFGRTKALTEGVAADGGNLVPIEFDTDLLSAIEEYGTVRRDSTVVNMTTNERDLRTVTAKPTISRKGELVASDESAAQFGKPQLKVDRYIGHQIISLEELEDNNVGLYDQLLTLYAEQFSKIEDTEGLTGSYYPGVLNSVTPTITRLASTSIKDVKYKELVKFKNSLSRGQLMRGGKFYMHRTIFALLEGMEDLQGRPITTNPFGPMGATMLGYAVELTEVMPTESDDAADKGFVIFGNLKWVYFGNRKGITAELLKEATLNKAGGGTINLASQGAVALAVHNRWGINVSIPTNLAVLKTKTV